MAPSPAGSASVQSAEVEDAGLRVAWRYAAREGAPGVGTLEIRVSDAATGAPVRNAGAGPKAWLQRRRPTLVEAETSCADRVKALRAPTVIGRRADIDVDTSRIVTLNTDGTLAVINPFVGLNNAKLEAIVELRGVPRAWLQLPERIEAWVALADPARLLAIDLQTVRVSRAIALPATTGDGRPQLAWDAAGRRLYVSLPGRAGIGIVDPAKPEEPLLFLSGPPAFGLFADTSGELSGAITLHADGSVLQRTDTGAPRLLWRADVDHDGVAKLARYSALTRRLVVVTDRGVLALLDPSNSAEHRPDPPPRIDLRHDVSAMELLDDGRRALLLGGGHASVVDLATGTRAVVLDTPAKANAIAVTGAYAYGISPAEGKAVMWRLMDLRRGETQPVEVTVGPPSPDAEADVATTGPGPVAVPTASRDGILIAGPAEGVIYQYGEGQMVYRGVFSNYRRAAAGLAMLDMALREVAPGRYRAPIRHAKGGLHTLVLAGEGPKFAACGQVALASVTAEDAIPAAVLRAELVQETDRGIADKEPYRVVRVRLSTASAGGTFVGGVPDLTLMLFDPLRGTSRRQRMHEVAGKPGEYEARLELPAGAARYDAMVASDSRGLSFERNAIGIVRVGTIGP